VGSPVIAIRRLGDVLSGGDGDHFLDGGPGFDALDGGPGLDVDAGGESSVAIP
jgi:hypothetical protein